MRDAASANRPRRRVRDAASSDGVERTNAQNARRGNRVPAGGSDCDDCGERTAEFCENPEHGESYCGGYYDNPRVCEDGVLTWCCDRDSSWPKCGDNYGECNHELSKKTAKKLAIGIIIGIVVAIIVIIASIVACCICCRRRGA
jgi:hypothetical protein